MWNLDSILNFSNIEQVLAMLVLNSREKCVFLNKQNPILDAGLRQLLVSSTGWLIRLFSKKMTDYLDLTSQISTF